jgi:hypothetical protein
MKWIGLISGALAVVAFATPAHAACPLPSGTVKVALPSGLPPALRDALRGDIALPGSRLTRPTHASKK